MSTPSEIAKRIRAWDDYKQDAADKLHAALSTAPADVKPDDDEREAAQHLAETESDLYHTNALLDRLAAENAELRAKLAEHNRHPGFRCPSCGGSFFGRDVANDAEGNPQCLPTVNCHDEFGVKCKWRGVWPEIAMSQISDSEGE